MPPQPSVGEWLMAVEVLSSECASGHIVPSGLVRDTARSGTESLHAVVGRSLWAGHTLQRNRTVRDWKMQWRVSPMCKDQLIDQAQCACRLTLMWANECDDVASVWE